MLPSFIKNKLPGVTKSSKRVAMELCDEMGLVYFGHVNQCDDEHHIVRGITVSNKHQDDHYCIGTYDGYDVIFVERADTLYAGKSHAWHIVEVDLKTTIDIPHVFMTPHSDVAGLHGLLKTKHHAMLPHVMGALQPYPANFSSVFNVHIVPARAVALEQLITPDIADKIGTHFKGLSIEITHDAVYVYSEKNHITVNSVKTMVTNGVWLAEQIDKNSRPLQ